MPPFWRFSWGWCHLLWVWPFARRGNQLLLPCSRNAGVFDDINVLMKDLVAVTWWRGQVQLSFLADWVVAVGNILYSISSVVSHAHFLSAVAHSDGQCAGIEWLWWGERKENGKILVTLHVEFWVNVLAFTCYSQELEGIEFNLAIFLDTYGTNISGSRGGSSLQEVLQ
jgi:hypothetical protein